MVEGVTTISFETLFEILRREKNRADLQNLPQTFLSSVAAYIQDREQALQIKEAQADTLSDTETRKMRMQLENTYKLVKELYARREKKILDMSLNKSRMQAGAIDTTAMLQEEALLFENLVSMLNQSKTIMMSTLLARSQEAPTQQLPTQEPQQEVQNEEPSQEEPQPAEPEQTAPVEQPEAPAVTSEETPPAQSTTKSIRFLEAVANFVGEELEVYGPYEKDDTAELPSKLAEILIKKGSAQEMVLEQSQPM